MFPNKTLVYRMRSVKGTLKMLKERIEQKSLNGKLDIYVCKKIIWIRGFRDWIICLQPKKNAFWQKIDDPFKTCL